MVVSSQTTAHFNTAGAEHGLHILVLDPAFRLSGQPEPTRTFDIARRLRKAGHRLSILTTRAALPESAAPEDIILDAMPMPRHRPGFELANATRGFGRGCAWRLWRHEAVDLVLAVDCPPAALFWATLFSFYRGVPLILDQRRVAQEPLASAPLPDRLAAFCGRLAFKMAAGFSRNVFATSTEVREHLLVAGVPPAKILLSPVSSDTAVQPSPGSTALLPVGGRVILYAGPFTPDAKLERVVALAPALQALTESEPLQIVFCGDGPSRARIEALATENGTLGKILWLAPPLPRRSIAQAMSEASAVLAPTIHLSAEISQGFYDALAAGKPMIATDAGVLRELVEARGAGIGLPPEPTAAAREVYEFLHDGDGLRRASQQAQALAAGRFNLERTLGDVRGAIEQTVAAAPRAVVLRRRLLRTKRVLDVVVSAVALVVLSPVMLGLTVAICVKMGWPPVFAQARPGLKGENFRIYKFRTMSTAKDTSGALLPDEARLTPLGKFLRRTSLDELPELVNVLMGDMSLVGPRPLLPEYLPHYTAEQRRRHDLRPGITGWSQVNGRNALSWEEKFKLDVWYVDNLSLWLDLKIILKTVWITLTGRGVNAPGHATMPRFDQVVAMREGAEDV